MSAGCLLLVFEAADAAVFSTQSVAGLAQMCMVAAVSASVKDVRDVCFTSNRVFNEQQSQSSLVAICWCFHNDYQQPAEAFQ